MKAPRPPQHGPASHLPARRCANCRLPHNSHRRIGLYLCRQSQLASLADGMFRVQLEQKLWGDVSADALVYHQMAWARHSAVGVPSRGGVAPRVVERGVAHLQRVEVALGPEHVVVCSQRQAKCCKLSASLGAAKFRCLQSVTSLASWFGIVKSTSQAMFV